MILWSYTTPIFSTDVPLYDVDSNYTVIIDRQAFM